MAARRIKESYGPPVIPKDATPQQRQQILQEHRKHQDLVKQLNDMRVALQGQIDELRAEPVIFAHAAGTTTGAGGITTVHNFGCRLSIAGTTVRMTFDQSRPNTNYVYGGTAVIGAARILVSPAFGSRSTSLADTRLYDDLNNPVSAATNVFSIMLWAFGPRA